MMELIGTTWTNPLSGMQWPTLDIRETLNAWIAQQPRGTTFSISGLAHEIMEASPEIYRENGIDFICEGLLEWCCNLIDLDGKGFHIDMRHHILLKPLHTFPPDRRHRYHCDYADLWQIL